MDFHRLARLFEAALGRPKQERAAWLSEACLDDPELRAEVAEMLAAHERADGILDRSIQTAAAEALRKQAEPDLGAGRYRLLHEVGRGGMGVVYKAHDPQLDRHVALKFLPPGLRADEQAKARFLAEARTASTLDHPSICTIYDIGEASDGRIFIAMAYYAGDTVREKIERGPLRPGDCIDIVAQVAEGLDRAHEAGIIHRDIKPSNIIVTPRGEAKILDFGVAKLEGGEALTRPGVVVGTPAYMAPEQLLGETVGPQADLWALGVVLYEMLTGQRPFTGDRAAVLRAIVHGDPEPVSRIRKDIPDAVDTILGKLLAKSPKDRYPRAQELVRHLAALGSGPARTERDASQRVSARADRVPTPLTTFVGREQELDEVKQLLTEARLLTLTGPGGTGKTRLGLRVASDVARDFPSGVCFVPLASISDAGLVASAILQALGVPESPGVRVLDQLEEFLKERALLLVLDNFEQVLDAAPIVVGLLESCPALKVLVTSRIALRLSGEHEYPVPALNLPDPDARHEIESLAGYSAIALFIDRARAAKPGFSLTQENAHAIAELCWKLDGLPLTIELAAARIKLFTPQAMVSRLGQRLDLLKGGPRDRPPRHQTVRQAMAWSYDLLSAEQQRTFRRMSVFVGGCTLEAAEAVCPAEEEPAIDLMDLLSALVDHSLVRQEEMLDGEPRFSMLETIRAYGLECLGLAGALAEASKAHSAYFLELAERAEPHLTGVQQATWLNRLALEHDNLRAAISWAEDTGEAQVGLRLGAALWRFWLVRGHMNEGRQRLERLLAIPAVADPTHARARALNGLGTLAHNQGDNHEARAFLEESLALFRAAGDDQGIAAVLNNLAWVACELCDFEAGSSLAREALELCRRLDDRRGLSVAVNNLGWVAIYRGEQQQARAYHEQSLALRREIGDQRGVAFALCNLAWAEKTAGLYEKATAYLDEAKSLLDVVDDNTLKGWMLNVRGRIAHDLGEHDRALEFLEQGRSLWSEGSNKSVLAWALTAMGEIELDRGNIERASGLLAQGLAGWREIDSAWGSASSHCDLGRVAHAQGEYERAVHLLRESLSIRHALADRLGVAECLEGLGHVASSVDLQPLAARLLGAAEELRESLGAPMPPSRSPEYDALRTALSAMLGNERLESEWSLGRQTEFGQVLSLVADIAIPL